MTTIVPCATAATAAVGAAAPSTVIPSKRATTSASSSSSFHHHGKRLPTRTYTIDILKEAMKIAEEKDKLISDTSKWYSIPLRSMHRFRNMLEDGTLGVELPTRGKPPLLSRTYEMSLAMYCQYEASMQRSVPIDIVKQYAKELYEHQCEQKRSTMQPGWVPVKWVGSDHWLAGMKKRVASLGCPLISKHPHLRSTQGATRQRYDQWLTELWHVINRYILHDVNGNALPFANDTDKQAYIQSRILNVDETGIARIKGDKLRVLVPPNSDAAIAIDKPSIDHITLVGGCDAAGGTMPLYFIVKGTPGNASDTLLERMSSVPKGTGFSISAKGWMTDVVWLQLLKFIVAYKQPSAASPIIMIVDNHTSRHNRDAIAYAKANHMHIFTMLPHMTSVGQPLDVAIYSPFKVILKRLITEAIARGDTINRDSIMLMIAKAHSESFTVSNIRSGWRACGMGVFEATMNTSLMSSDKFACDTDTLPHSILISSSQSSSSCVVPYISSSSSSSSAAAARVSTSVQWVAPANIEHILKPIIRPPAERKRAPVISGCITSDAAASILNDRRDAKEVKEEKKKEKESKKASAAAAAACVALVPVARATPKKKAKKTRARSKKKHRSTTNNNTHIHANACCDDHHAAPPPSQPSQPSPIDYDDQPIYIPLDVDDDVYDIPFIPSIVAVALSSSSFASSSSSSSHAIICAPSPSPSPPIPPMASRVASAATRAYAALHEHQAREQIDAHHQARINRIAQHGKPATKKRKR